MASTIKDARSYNLDSPSMYQVKNFASYSLNEKMAMFEYLGVLNSKKNSTIHNMQTQIESLTSEIMSQNNIISSLNERLRIICLTNDLLHTDKEFASNLVEKEQKILNHWARSHKNLSYIISAQIPDQCVKILCGDMNEAEKLIYAKEKGTRISFKC
jgi:predicted RNase H-like nuclease (RuvC/YqgF family)